MIPREEELQYCIMQNGQIADGAFGLAIGATEQEAWARAVDPCEDWVIQRCLDRGDVVRRCTIMVINP